METSDVVKDSKIVGGAMTVRYHNKGIEMLQLPKILHSKSVRDTIPQFLSNRKPPGRHIPSSMCFRTLHPYLLTMPA